MEAVLVKTKCLMLSSNQLALDFISQAPLSMLFTDQTNASLK